MTSRMFAVALGVVVLMGGWADRAWGYACIVGGCRGYCKLPVAYSLGTPSEDMGIDVSETEVRRAVEIWTMPACSGLRVQYAGRTDQKPASGNGVIAWVEQGWPNGNGVIGTTTSRIGGSCLQSHMILNGQDFTWATAAPAKTKQVNTFSIVGHEAGHFFGLGHSMVKESIMWASYSGGIKMLTDDDVQGICQLYPVNGAAVLDGGAPPTVRRDGGAVLMSRPDAASMTPIVQGRDAGSVVSPAPQPTNPPVPLPMAPRDAGPGAIVPSPTGQLTDGTACRFNDECLSELCLERDRKPPVCTRPCDSNADCRKGFTCFTWPGGARLCEAPVGAVRDAGAPPSSTAKEKSRGCDCSVGQAPSSGAGLFVLLAGFLGIGLRRSKRRARENP